MKQVKITSLRLLDYIIFLNFFKKEVSQLILPFSIPLPLCDSL